MRAFYAELLPMMVKTVKQGRLTMQLAGDVAETPELPVDFLSLRDDGFELKAAKLMGCDTGFCNLDVEWQLEDLQTWSEEHGWGSVVRMYDDPERRNRINAIFARNEI